MRIGLAVKISVIALAVLIQLSCAPKRALKPAEFKAYEGPVTVEILKKSIIFNSLKPIKSEVNIEVLRDGKPAGSYEGILAYMPPNSVDIRLFGPLGFTAVDAVITNNILQVYIPLKETLYEGHIETPFLSNAEGHVYSMEKTEDSYILYSFKTNNSESIKDKELIGRYVFSSSAPINTDISLYSNKKKFCDISFGEFMAASQNENRLLKHEDIIPVFIKISMSNSMTLNIRLIEPELPEEIHEDYFRLKDYEGKRVISLQELLKRGH